jgi:small GTP-binding protein
VSLHAILTPAEQDVLRDERRLLNDLRATLVRLGATDDTLAPLQQSIEQLDELFLLVVVGEFNAGKSAFINALAGTRLMEEGATPTTASVTPVRYEDILIVDTPGTNAIIREHEAITSAYVPRADLVLFVTSADRPFTETERAFLEQIRSWGKKVVLVINKSDILTSDRDRDAVRAYVADNARRLLGVTPDVFFVSARLAFRAKTGEPQHWSESGFEALERYIRTTLDQAARTRLKLLNPVGVAGALIERFSTSVRERLDLLRDDVRLLADVEADIEVYASDMARQFSGRMAAVDNVLLEMERRGYDYFDDTMRIGRVVDLLNRSRVQEGFERQVVADAPQQIERRVDELVVWLVEADFRQWQRVTRHLAQRRSEFRERIVGDAQAEADERPFNEERRRMLESVGVAAQRVVDTYDRRREASELADGARNAVAAAAAAGAGAVGLGTLVTVAASTAAADVTGIILASVIAALGFFIIPARRSQAKATMRRKIADVRARLSEALRKQFETEIARGIERLREGIGPYGRFVRSETASLQSSEGHLRDLERDLGSVRQRIDSLAA